jgi:hypothetical protein
MSPENPSWFMPPVGSSEASPKVEEVPVSNTPERTPVLQSIIDVLDSEGDKDKAVELSNLLSHWREVTKKNNGGNPMIAHQQIFDFTRQLGGIYPADQIDRVLMFHLISGSTVNVAEKSSYVFDIPTQNTSGQGVIESKIRDLSSSVE